MKSVLRVYILLWISICAQVYDARRADDSYESVQYSDEDMRKDKESDIDKEEDSRVHNGRSKGRTGERKEEFDYDGAQYEGYDRRYEKPPKDMEHDLIIDEAQYEGDEEVESHQAQEVENESNNTGRVKKEELATIAMEPRLFTRRSYADAAPEDIPAIEKGTRRIFNADETAAIVDYPFMAAILFNGELWCSGVVIDADKVLTTAHCLQIQFNNRFFKEFVHMISVRVGSNNATSGGQVWNITQIYFHPHYRATTLAYNIAVIKLQNNITFDANVRSIKYYKRAIELNNLNITFLGWGTVDDSSVRGGRVLLQKITLPIYNTRDCQEVYGSDLVTANNFCAGYISIMKNVCNHDAGGPALLNGEVLGLLSFTFSRCDVMDKPAVFVYVPKFLLWLDNIHDRSMNNHNIAG